MKLIDIFNKIANGEDLPNKIKYNDNVYEYDDSSKEYRIMNNYFYLTQTIANDTRDLDIILNDEVEVIKRKMEIDEEEYLVLVDAYNKLNNLKRRNII